MRGPLHIIAACADRKRVKAPLGRCLRSHVATPGKARFQSFIDSLKAASAHSMPAIELYVGGYWAAVRELPSVAEAQGIRSTLWVASAGYGLIPSSAKVVPYSATFQAGVPDAVAEVSSEHAVRDQVAAWWAALASWQGPSRSSPRTLSALARSEPRATFLVVASPRYVQAMSQDLEDAAANLSGRLLVVTSADGVGEPRLAPFIVPSAAALLPTVGGSLPTLHARVAKHILLGSSRHGLNAASLRRRYSTLIEKSDYAGMPARDEASDTEVKAFIRRKVRIAPDLKYSPALRLWRSAGRACEQKRFKRLFQEVIARHV